MDFAGLKRGPAAAKRKAPSTLRSKSLKPLGEGKQTLWIVRLKEGDQWKSVRHQAPSPSLRALFPRKESFELLGRAAKPLAHRA